MFNIYADKTYCKHSNECDNKECDRKIKLSIQDQGKYDIWYSNFEKSLAIFDKQTKASSLPIFC